MASDTFFKKIIYYSFHALLLLTPLIWTAKTSELFEFPKMIFVYLMTTIIVTAWVARMVIQKRPLIQKTYFDIPLILFLTSQVISTVSSIDPHTSLYGYYSRFHGGLLSTISYILLYYAFVSNIGNQPRSGLNKFSDISLTWPTAKHQSKSSKAAHASSFEISENFVDKLLRASSPTKNLLKTTLIGAVLASLYAFPEHFGVSPSCQLIGAGFQADCWVQDVVTRVFGTFGQPNWLAAYLIALIFIPLSFLLSGKNQHGEVNNFFSKTGTWPTAKHQSFTKNKSQAKSLVLEKKFIYAALLPTIVFALFFAVLIFTKSRSGILGFALGLIVFSLASLIISTNKKKAVSVLLACYLLLTTIYLSWGKGAIPQIDQFFAGKSAPTTSQTTPTPVITGTVLDNGGTESGDIRKIVWTGALDVFRAYPLFGSGVETFAYSYYNFRPQSHNLTSEWDFLYNKAHNEFLNHLANSGIFGLTSYLILILSFSLFSLKQVFGRSNGEGNGLFRNRSHLSETQASSPKRSQTNKVVALSDGEKDDFRSPQPTLLILALFSGYIALAISNFFGFSTVPVGLLFFLFPAFAFALTSQERPIADDSPELQFKPSSFLLFIVLLVGLATVFQVYKMYAADLAYARGKSANDQNQVQLALTDLEKAIKLLPSEPTYKDEFSQAATNASLYFYEQNQASAAAKVASLAIAAGNQALDQNRVHLNFYKTHARLLANLGAHEAQLLESAITTLKRAIDLSPTDAKLYFSLGMVYYQMQDLDNTLLYVEKSIDLKPNYELARYTLGEIYLSQDREEDAKAQFIYILEHITATNAKAKLKLEEIQSN